MTDKLTSFELELEAALKQAEPDRRLELRCDDEQRELLDRAVALSGRSLTDFVLAAAQEAAMTTIRNFETMKLNAKDSVAFAQALLNPPEPNAAFAQAEHLSRALDKLLPRVGRTISHGPFEPTEVVDEPYKDPDEDQ